MNDTDRLDEIQVWKRYFYFYTLRSFLNGVTNKLLPQPVEKNIWSAQDIEQWFAEKANYHWDREDRLLTCLQIRDRYFPDMNRMAFYQRLHRGKITLPAFALSLSKKRKLWSKKACDRYFSKTGAENGQDGDSSEKAD